MHTEKVSETERERETLHTRFIFPSRKHSTALSFSSWELVPPRGFDRFWSCYCWRSIVVVPLINDDYGEGIWKTAHVWVVSERKVVCLAGRNNCLALFRTNYDREWDKDLYRERIWWSIFVCDIRAPK